MKSQNTKKGQTDCAVDRFFLFATAIFTAPCCIPPTPHYYAQRSLSAPAVGSAALIRVANIFVINDGRGNHMKVQRCEMTNYRSGAKNCCCMSDCTGCPRTLFYLCHYAAI